MQTILVTGATGFIGNCLVKKLLAKNYTVRVLLRNPHPSTHLPAHVQHVTGDLTLPHTLAKACEGVDTVYHLGGYAHAWEETQPAVAALHQKINFEGTKNILNAAQAAGVKTFIFFSTVKAVADSEQCIDESWQQWPTSPYGIAKREAEQLVIAAATTHMHTCVLRPALVYGPHWKGNLAAMLRAIDHKRFLPLPPTQNARSMISQKDICEAAILAANHPNANGKTYFVTDGIAYSTSQLYTLMCEALNQHVPRWHVPLWFFQILAHIGDVGKKILRRRMPFDSDTLKKLFGSAEYDSSCIQQELGFKPQYTLQSMLPEIIAHYRQEQLTHGIQPSSAA